MPPAIVTGFPPGLGSLPQDLRELTSEQTEKFVRYLATTFPLESNKLGKLGLRQRQDLMNNQIFDANEQLKTATGAVKTRLERGRASCRVMHDILCAAVDLQNFGGDSSDWKAHVGTLMLPEDNPERATKIVEVYG